VTAPPSPSRARRAVAGIPLALAATLLIDDLRLAQALSYSGDRVLLIPVAVIVGAVLCGLGLRVLVLALFLGAVALWTAVAFTPLDRALADGLPRADPLGPADVIYVLASDVQPDGDLTSESLSRLTHGLELAGQGLAQRIVVGELPAPHGRFAEAARRYIAELHLGIEVLSVGPVTTTHDEGVLVAELFRQHGWRRVLLVTSPFHSRRAAAVFEAAGLEVVSAPTREGKYNVEALATADERLRAFSDILHERLGSWIYRRRGWVSPASEPPR
jgi:uncharacterized SAM-binding protein YcdF (DUF218 family)